MRSSRCVFSTAAALHRVFVAPIELSHLKLAPPNALLPKSTFNAPRVLCPQRRSLVNLHRAEKSRLPRDDEIKSWKVCLVSEIGTLSEPRSTTAILKSMDRKKDSLVVVKMGEAAGDPPVCKIMNKLAMREAEKARLKSEKKKGGITVKNMELNWAIDGNDLGHRLNKMKEFLLKGQKVEVMLAGKKKGRKATDEEAQAVVRKIKDAMEDVGAKEMKPMEGKMGATVTIFLEGKVPKPAAPEKESEASKIPVQSPAEASAEAPADNVVEKKRRLRWEPLPETEPNPNSTISPFRQIKSRR